MRWPNVEATIDGAGAFVVEPFPTIEIAVQGDGAVNEGARSHLATVDLMFDNAAFLAPQDDIEVLLTNVADGSNIDIELEPAEIVEDKVYKLRVYGILPDDGQYQLSATLRSNHLERDFVAVATPAVQDFELTTPIPIPLYSGIGVAAFIVLIFLILLARSLIQSSPYGNLYRVGPNDQRILVADFRNYRGSAWDRLMNKTIVPAAAMPGIPLHGGRFTFAARGVDINYNPDSDGLLNVMISGEPIQSGSTPIPDGEEFKIGSETFVFDRTEASPDVQISERLTQPRKERNEELDTFALDPMTWDAPSSARPTRRYFRPG